MKTNKDRKKIFRERLFLLFIPFFLLLPFSSFAAPCAGTCRVFGCSFYGEIDHSGDCSYYQNCCIKASDLDTSGADPDPIGAGLGAGGVTQDPNVGVGGLKGGTVTPGTSGIPLNASSTSSATRSGSTGGLVPCTDDCTLCHLVIGFKNIYDYLFEILLAASTLVIVIAGIMYMVSSGNKGMLEKAKSALGYALTAMILALVAWLVINATLHALGYKNVGNWYTFTCDTVQSKGAGTLGAGGATLPATPGQNTGTPNGNCGGIPTSGNANGQCQYASSKLSSTLDCIKGKMAYEPSEKSGISNLLAYSIRIKSAKAASGVNISSLYRPQSGNSCHAGGRNCKGETNAADLTGNMDAAAQAAIACGADTVIYQAKAYAGGNVYTNASDHYDHVHISVNNAQCGCDYLK